MHFGPINAEYISDDAVSRRKFLEFLGAVGVSTGVASNAVARDTDSNEGIKPSSEDKVITAAGVKQNVLAAFGDLINSDKGERFGFNNDYIGITPAKNGKDIWMVVNHETADPLIVSGYKKGENRTLRQVQKERLAVGVSILYLMKTESGWKFDPKDNRNKRVHGLSQIGIKGAYSLLGASKVEGTQNNCAGGVTDWGTFLTCEENYADHWGEVKYLSPGRSKRIAPSKAYGWGQTIDKHPEHYGWVTEIDPESGESYKLIHLGRFAHEGATFTRSKEGFPVVYMGDDAKDQCLYKFVSSSKDNLEEGVLYVANIGLGKWIPLNRALSPVLKKAFKDHTEMMIHTRFAASLVGGTPLPRPEGIAIHPKNGDVYVSLTNNSNKGNYFGYIAKVTETANDAGSEDFTFDVFAAGGPKSGFACPDNVAFDAKGNLWMTSDISDGKLGKGVYSSFGNNGLFVFATQGENAGKAVQVASAPNRAEFTGPCFAPDGKSMFLSVQHPGAGTKDLKAPLSKWAVRNDGVPRPAVLELSGKLFEDLAFI